MAEHYPTGVEPDDSLQGRVLIAHPRLDSSRWARTVVFIFEHNQLGAQGVVINNPSEIPLYEAFDRGEAAALTQNTIYIGGPKNPRGAYLLHSAEWSSSNTRYINDRYAISSDGTMIERMSMLGEPAYWKMCVGAASWDTGQLEDEIDQGIWLTCDAVDSIVFGCNGLGQWKHAIEHHSASVFAQYI